MHPRPQPRSRASCTPTPTTSCNPALNPGAWASTRRSAPTARLRFLGFVFGGETLHPTPWHLPIGTNSTTARGRLIAMADLQLHSLLPDAPRTCHSTARSSSPSRRITLMSPLLTSCSGVGGRGGRGGGAEGSGQRKNDENAGQQVTKKLAQVTGPVTALCQLHPHMGCYAPAAASHPHPPTTPASPTSATAAAARPPTNPHTQPDPP